MREFSFPNLIPCDPNSQLIQTSNGSLDSFKTQWRQGNCTVSSFHCGWECNQRQNNNHGNFTSMPKPTTSTSDSDSPPQLTDTNPLGTSPSSTSPFSSCFLNSPYQSLHTPQTQHTKEVALQPNSWKLSTYFDLGCPKRRNHMFHVWRLMYVTYLSNLHNFTLYLLIYISKYSEGGFSRS